MEKYYKSTISRCKSYFSSIKQALRFFSAPTSVELEFPPPWLNKTKPLRDLFLFGASGESRTLIPSLENLYTNRCTTLAKYAFVNSQKARSRKLAKSLPPHREKAHSHLGQESLPLGTLRRFDSCVSRALAWGGKQELNLRPSGPQSDALTN